ncbi:MinD/ParA family protein, partial [Mycobacteroides abscessus subsp. abscessus]
ARQFLTRARAVHVIPYDDHLAQGSEVTLDLVGWKARLALLELAASVADGFSHPNKRDDWNGSGWSRSIERRRR